MVARRTQGTGETKPEKPEPIAASALAPGSNSGANAVLLSFCERFERVSEEIKALSDDRTEIMSEAKAHGFDTKILRMAIRRRAMESADRMEMDVLLDIYETAIKRASANARQKSVDEGGE